MADDAVCLNAPQSGREYQMWLQKKDREPLNRTETCSEVFLASSDCYFTAKSCRNISVYSPHPSPEKPSSAFCARECKAAKFSLRCLLPLLLHLPFFKRPCMDSQLPFSAIPFCCELLCSCHSGFGANPAPVGTEKSLGCH